MSGYLYRHVFGAFSPYPGIAIFCMLLTYYMWIKAVKTGSISWATMCALAYFYMVSLKTPPLIWAFLARNACEQMSDTCFWWFTGFVLGRLCVFDQFDSPSRPCPDADWPLLPSDLCRLLHCVLSGHHPVYADFLCRIPGMFSCMLSWICWNISLYVMQQKMPRNPTNLHYKIIKKKVLPPPNYPCGTLWSFGGTRG